MVVRSFPPVEQADEYGLLAIGGDLEVESLLQAYRSGIFPWPIADVEALTWFSPDPRAILYLDDFRLSRSSRRNIRRSNFEFSFNKSFSEVIDACASSPNRKIGDGSWITAEMVAAYNSLHHAGFSHSVECRQLGELVGGLYGVSIGGFFAGESMFYRRDDASKGALMFLIDHLKAQGVQWIDCQVKNDLFESLGAREISRSEYLKLLKTAVANPPILFV